MTLRRKRLAMPQRVNQAARWSRSPRFPTLRSVWRGWLRSHPPAEVCQTSVRRPSSHTNRQSLQRRDAPAIVPTKALLVCGRVLVLRRRPPARTLRSRAVSQTGRVSVSAVVAVASSTKRRRNHRRTRRKGVPWVSMMIWRCVATSTSVNARSARTDANSRSLAEALIVAMKAPSLLPFAPHQDAVSMLGSTSCAF